MIFDADLEDVSRGDLKHLVGLLRRQVEKLEQRIIQQDKRIAELEARMNEPPKDSSNSSVPPSKGFKANKGKDSKERTGPRAGSVGRKGTNRPLAENPDKIVRVMAKSCCQCHGALSEADQTLHHAYDKVDIPPVKPIVTRVEIYEGVCSCCSHKTAPAVVPEGLEEGSPF